MGAVLEFKIRDEEVFPKVIDSTNFRAFQGTHSFRFLPLPLAAFTAFAVVTVPVCFPCFRDARPRLRLIHRSTSFTRAYGDARLHRDESRSGVLPCEAVARLGAVESMGSRGWDLQTDGAD